MTDQEPSSIRDYGPFEGSVQALRQFASESFGMPGRSSFEQAHMIVLGPVVASGAKPSEWELEYFGGWINKVGLDPIIAQILSAWITRAHIAGVEQDS